MVEKVEGLEQTCKCGTVLICVKIIKEWQRKKEEKLQWQNKSDRTPHFKFAGNGKFDCVVPDTEQSTTSQQTTEPKPFKREHVSADEEIIWNGILDMLMEFDILADRRFAIHSNFDSSNPAHVGQIKNWAFSILQEVKKQKREESS